MEPIELLRHIEARFDRVDERAESRHAELAAKLDSRIERHDARLRAVEGAISQMKLVGAAAGALFASACGWAFNRS